MRSAFRFEFSLMDDFILQFFFVLKANMRYLDRHVCLYRSQKMVRLDT